MKNKKHSKMSLLALLGVGLSLLGAPKATAQKLEQIISIPKNTIATEYPLENKYPNITGEKTSYRFDTRYCLIKEDKSTLNPIEQSQIGDLIAKTKTGTINSYSDLVNFSKSFSVKQKFALLSATSELLYSKGYDLNYKGEVFSQDEFFGFLQNMFKFRERYPLGVCRQIAYYTGQLSNELGIKNSVVTGMSHRVVGHMYNVLKTKEETAAIEGEQLFLTKTKNIEKLLRTFQKEYLKAPSFQHLFFEGLEFKYKLITEEGKTFLNFAGDNQSSKNSRDFLLNKEESSIKPEMQFILENRNNFISLEKNYPIFFIKGGIINTDSFSPMLLLQSGYQKKFITPNLTITPSTSVVLGKKLYGLFADLTTKTNNETGFNFASITSAKQVGGIFPLNHSFFYDLFNTIGISYNFSPSENFNTEPYFTIKASNFYKNIGTETFAIYLDETEFGTKFSFSIPQKLDISLNPYYIKRVWEQEFGINTRIKTGNFGLNLESNLTKSNYIFCPDKFKLNLGVFALVKNLELNLGYKTEQTDYDGEKEDNSLLSLTGKIGL